MLYTKHLGDSSILRRQKKKPYPVFLGAQGVTAEGQPPFCARTLRARQSPFCARA
jgi:hypothetical protein